MNTYEFHGSIRIEANSEDEACAVIDEIEKKINCEIHVNDMEVVG